MPSYHIASPLAMLASAMAGALSIAVLVEPAIHAGFTVTVAVGVAVSVGLVLLTITTGILAHMRGLCLGGLGLAALSLAGSGLIVWEQGARRAQTQVAASTSAELTTRERERLLRKRAEADEILARHRRDQAAECASGRGKRCDGISYTVATWEAALAGYDAKLRGLPAPAPDAKGERVATAAGLLGYDARAARVWVSLLDPLAMPVWLEWVSILCGILAVGKRRIVADAPAVSAEATVSAGAAVTGISAIATGGNVGNVGNVPPKPAVRPAPITPVVIPDDDETIIVGLRRLGGEAYSQQALAKAMGICPAEAHRRLKKSKVVERIRQDNRVVVRLKPQCA